MRLVLNAISITIFIAFYESIHHRHFFSCCPFVRGKFGNGALFCGIDVECTWQWYSSSKGGEISLWKIVGGSGTASSAVCPFVSFLLLIILDLMLDILQEDVYFFLYESLAFRVRYPGFSKRHSNSFCNFQSVEIGFLMWCSISS